MLYLLSINIYTSLFSLYLYTLFVCQFGWCATILFNINKRIIKNCYIHTFHKNISLKSTGVRATRVFPQNIHRNALNCFCNENIFKIYYYIMSYYLYYIILCFYIILLYYDIILFYYITLLYIIILLCYIVLYI